MSYKTTIQNIPSNGLFHRVEQLHTLLLLLLMVVLGSGMAWGQATYTYYAFHNKDKGYMKQCKGIVFNDNTFRYENAYDGNGSSIWILSSDGYLQQEMYYLNVANDKTLYLSTTPITTWNLVDADGKKRIQMRGSTKILGYNSGSYPVLADNPTYKYAACTLTVTEEGGKWEGPKDIDITVQSPQLLSYLRTYYLRNITVTIGKNDAGTENAKVVDKKDSRCYCMRTYKATSDANKGTKWDYDTDTKVIYNLTTSDQAVTATYDIAPLDPIARNAHPATEKSSKVTIKPKAFTPNTTKKYLLFNIQEEDYRFPKATSSLSEGDMLPVDGKKSELTEAINGDLSWDVEVDAEGYYSFKNVTTGRYIYYDADDYTKNDYGVVKIGATELPSDDTRYKFRIFNCGNFDPFGACNYIIPFDKQFAVYNNSGAIEEIFFAIYPNTSSKIGSISKVSNNIKWKFYSYEWQYRLWSDYTISGEQEVYTSGNHDYTATTWFSRNIKDSPNNSDYCTQPGYKTQTGITYTWQLTGLDDYVTTSDELSSGTSTLTANVTLPPGTRTGTLKVTAKITSPANLTNNTSIPIALYNLSPTFTEIGSLSQITDASGLYKLTGNNTYSSDNKPAVTTFSGTLDGGNYTISGLSAPLFQTIDGGTVRNLMVDNITITSGNSNGDVGAICCEAKGNARIYNCGVLTSRSTVTSDDDGYTKITSNSSTISGSRYVGGLVGLLDESARVINCFSYANITSGTNVGGIVGYNNVATTSSNLKTMVMNCMFYGDITGGTNKAPIYNGKNISNKDANGVSNYNYFWGGASYVQNQNIQTYNCALMAETRFLQRFEFFRHLLNSHRELAAWWATGSTANKDEMAKWVLLPSQIGSSTPYPVLAKPDYYPSVVNIDAKNATIQTERNKGGKLGTLSVAIRMGSGGAQFAPPSDAEIVTTSLTLNITDKDPEHFNFNYYKVQLPYYNDVGTKNYTGNRVVTGWKIVSITGGIPGTFSTSTADAPSFNFADRNCTNKDLYSTSGRVFNQGAYWDVPEGVTAITIEPYWAKAAYLADPNADKVYNSNMSTAYDVPNIGGGVIYKNGSSYNIAGDNQVVYTSVTSARDAIGTHSGHTVYDYAIVLVGNAHYIGISSNNSAYFYTLMSADFDGDNEPDYSYILRFNGRAETHPVRVDFLNIPGLGMAQKSDGGTGSYNFGIMQPIGWFESTNTSLFRVTQFEYDRSNRGAAPLILQGGVMEQWVSGQNNGAANKTTYYHVGGNVWFKEFHRGTHQDKDYTSKHPPISVTGGDFDEFYLTGLYRADVTNYDDNAECYINGGRFGVVAGTGMEGIGNASTHSNGNITWQIQNADIREFYGGGINAAHIAEGNITTTITGGKIDLFCGGPKFGDMNTGKTVVTTATGCEFGSFFGAGYGGNSYSRRAPTNKNNVTNIDWNSWVKTEYTLASATGFPGISTQFNYQFLPMSDNTSNVARLFVEHVTFSLATTHDVTSTLTDCDITGDFYGGGSLGKVDGPVTSTLDNCKVKGNVYGAGYSASLPTVEVDSIGFRVEPLYYTDLGTYRMGVKGKTTTYTWEHGNAVGIDKDNHVLYTTVDLTGLGTVTGNVTLNIRGTTEVAGDVYGGGALASSNTDYAKAVSPVTTTLTTINLLGGTITGNVYGGGMGQLAAEAVGTPGTTGYVAAKEDVEAKVGNTLVNLNGMAAAEYKEAYSSWGLEQAETDGPYTVANTAKGCVVGGSIFGCNNINGTPLGNATVHVYKTQNAAASQIGNTNEVTNAKEKGRYDLTAVYGGGNLAAFIPAAANESTASTHVIIDGCDLTSIETVYGGGNAASTPATEVTVKGTFEIKELFGGGNGLTALPDGKPNPGANVGYKNYTEYYTEDGVVKARDKEDADTKEERLASGYVYGTGAANVTIYGGTIHQVFGGSNTKGNVRISAVTLLEDQDVCEFCVDEAYGGGKSAPMDAEAKLLMSCIPGLKAAYGGAEAANIEGDVTLNITNGNFDRVFGGNNKSGRIGGTITVNIEETGCKPVIIGQLYGGGNQAPYTAPFVKDDGGNDTEVRQHGPTLNIRSFTSIGEVYGGGYGEGAVVTGDTYVNINEVVGDNSSQDEFMKEKVADVTDPATQTTGTDKVSKNTGVTKTFKDGDGDDANTISVDIPLHKKDDIGSIGVVFGGGNAAQVVGNTHVNIGTASSVDYVTKASGESVARTGITPVGADIRGNVYGGGNNAEVTGDTHVVIGEKYETP
ncbi:MAG: hypothetical protein J6M15_10815 [Prevotella sp.]|nr:hypothetical protein [Prevotella sp.]